MHQALKQALATLVGLAVVMLASAAGNSGQPPTAAPTALFCAEFDRFYAGVDARADVADLLRQLGDRLEQLGTPESIPDDARDGFELTLAAIEALPADAGPDDVAALDAGLDEQEQQKVDQFDRYLNRTCLTPYGGEA